MNERHQGTPGGGDDERLVDYLYDELAPLERERFEVELAQRPALMAELTAMQETRAQFADGLEATLEPMPFAGSASPPYEMPRGLLDDVLALADQQAAEFARSAAPGAIAAPSSVAPADSSPTFWQRLAEGLKRLVFQPAFAMGMVLLLVAGVALVATRNPSGLIGTELPRDVQRIPPVAMAPADQPGAQAEAKAELAEPSADLAEGQPLQAAAAEIPEEFFEARAKGDLDQLNQGYRPATPDPSGVAMAAGGEARPASRAARDKDDGGAKEELAKVAEPARERARPTAAKATAGARAEEERAAEVADVAVARGDARPAQPDSARSFARQNAAAPAAPSAPGPKTTSKEPATAPTAEHATRDGEGLEDARDAERGAATKTAEVAAPARKVRSDDSASEPPPAPTSAPTKPSEPAPSSDRLYTTLNQQLAAGAFTDAERSLTELARLEGESARVKKAREAIAKAKAATTKQPADTKPLPEPAKTPTP